jgi:hypothetical protein
VIYLYSTTPRLNLVTTLLDSFAGLKNLPTTIIHKVVHWENIRDEEMASFKHLTIPRDSLACVPCGKVFDVNTVYRREYATLCRHLTAVHVGFVI